MTSSFQLQRPKGCLWLFCFQQAILAPVVGGLVFIGQQRVMHAVLARYPQLSLYWYSYLVVAVGLLVAGVAIAADVWDSGPRSIRNAKVYLWTVMAAIVVLASVGPPQDIPQDLRVALTQGRVEGAKFAVVGALIWLGYLALRNRKVLSLPSGALEHKPNKTPTSRAIGTSLGRLARSALSWLRRRNPHRRGSVLSASAILAGGAVALAAALAFPPWQASWKGLPPNPTWAPIWAPPWRAASYINTRLLLVEMIGIAAIAVLLAVAASRTKE